MHWGVVQDIVSASWSHASIHARASGCREQNASSLPRPITIMGRPEFRADASIRRSSQYGNFYLCLDRGRTRKCAPPTMRGITPRTFGLYVHQLDSESPGTHWLTERAWGAAC